MAVALGNPTVRMSQGLLHDKKRTTRVNQHRGEAVAQIVEPKPRHPGLLSYTNPCMSDMGVRLTRILVDENEVEFPLGADLVKNIQRGIRQGHSPGLAAFAVRGGYPPNAVLSIDQAPLCRQRFVHTAARRQEEHADQSDVTARIGFQNSQQFLQLVIVKKMLNLIVLVEQLDARCRVFLQHFPLDRQSEHSSDQFCDVID